MREESVDPALVGVVVTVHNRHEYLDAALDTIFGQTLMPGHVVVVDDGSTRSATLEHLRAIETKYPVKVHAIANRGLAGARNFGRSLLDADYLLFLDDDDEILPDYLNATVAELEADSDVGVAYAGAEFFGDLDGVWDLPSYDPVEILWENMVYSSAVVRARAFDQVGGYDDTLRRGREDHDLWIRMTAAGWGFRRVSDVLFRYRQTSTSMNHSIGGDVGEMAKTYARIMRGSGDYYLQHADVLWERIFELRSQNRRYRRLYGTLDERMKSLKGLVRRARNAMSANREGGR